MFEILGKLGVGGMADVFLANADIGGRVQAVALKRIRASMSDCADVWPMFQREAELCKLLNHPAIVQLKAVGDDASGPYLALEYVAGATVAELIRACARRGTPIALEHGLSICRDVAAGIAYAHGLVHEAGRGLVHRDITPENVLVGYDGFAKVTDFGIAWLVGHTRFTRTGAVRGKVGYLAPELVEGAPPSPASDVFSLAATVFRVLTGQFAYKGNNDGELLRSLMFGPTPSIAAARADVPKPIAEWCDRAFGKDPAKRPSAGDLVALIPESSDARRADLGRWLTSVCPPRVFTAQGGGARPAEPGAPLRPPPGSGPLDAGPTVVDRPQPPPEPHADNVQTALFDTLAKGKWRLAMLLLVLAAAGAAAFFLWPREAPPPVEVAAAPAEEPAVLPDPEPDPEALALPEEVEPAPETTTEPRPATPRRAVRRGLLDVRVSPYADVFVDGKLVGTTPLKPIELAPGTHKVLLVNAELDLHKTVRVTIAPGRKTRLTENFKPKR